MIGGKTLLEAGDSRRDEDMMPWRLPPPLRGPAVVLSWVLLAFAAYSFQLSGGWRFDDGHHLAFLAGHGHFEYIYDAAAARLQSGAHYTPFNILTYDIPHRLAPFSRPAWFYAFHIALIGLAAAALHAYLRLLAGRAGGLVGAIVFLLGFPMAGMSGQLMVGHYIVGFGFAGLCLHAYERAARMGRASLAAVPLYLLACLSKEIFLPLILFPALDPRFGLRQRLLRTLPWLAAAALFWLVRTLVVANVVGGYNDGLPAPPLAALRDVLGGLYAYGTMTAGAAAMSLALALCCLIALAALWRRFGPAAAAAVAAGAAAGTVLPLLPVALQVSPDVPTDIRLLSGVGFVLALAAAVAVRAAARLPARLAVSGLVVLTTVWATVDYVRTAPLFPFGREFDAVTRSLVERRDCYLVDKYGWSSWLYDLNRAMWPGSPPPLMAPREILDIRGEPGHAVCTFDSAGIHEAGRVPAGAGCAANAALSLDFRYTGSHLVMNFGPDPDSVYYIEVPGAYFLKVPASFVMAYPDRRRLEDFRLLKIGADGAVACSPLLHFDPASRPGLRWKSG